MVCGPTASGKSALAVEIARKFSGEIVSADSMQIYKEMNIGTAKPDEIEKGGITHHLVDFLPVSEEYSVSQFVQDANKCIDDILSKNKVAVVCGGTGLYIDSLINNVQFLKTENSDEIRQELNVFLKENGIEALFERLKKVDPQAAESIHMNNTKRVIRALEINMLTGKTLSAVNAQSVKSRKYKTLFIGVNFRNRENLYNRINLRVDQMIKSGLVEEAEMIHNQKLSKTAIGAIGYKEIFDYLDGKADLDTSVEVLKQKTRNYAKRQITWFKRNDEINWFYPDEYDNYSLFLNTVIDFCKNKRFK